MNPRSTLAACLTLTLSLVACGTGHTPGPVDTMAAQGVNTAPVISAFTATPATLPYGGGPVTLKWTTSDATFLTIDPGVGPVTGTTSKTLQVPATRTFTLTATNRWGSARRTITVQVADAVPTITVSGQVRSAAGAPLGGVTLAMPGRAPLTTDASGTFSFTNVTQPYTLIATDPDTGVRQVYQGVTTQGPLVTFARTRPRTASAQITGTITGGEAGATTSVSAAPRGFTNATTTPSSSYTLTARWGESETETASLHALQWVTDSAGRNERFTGYSEGVIKLQNTWGYGYNLPLSPLPSQGALAGVVNFPNGYVPDQQSVLITYPRTTQPNTGEVTGGDTYPLETVYGGTRNLYFRTPGIPGAKFTVSASATGPNGETATVSQRDLGAAYDGLQLNTFAAPVLTTNHETSATGTFTWTDNLTGLYRATFIDQRTFAVTYVFTERKEITPDLLALTAGHAVEWTVDRSDGRTLDGLLTGAATPVISSGAGSARQIFTAR